MCAFYVIQRISRRLAAINVSGNPHCIMPTKTILKSIGLLLFPTCIIIFVVGCNASEKKPSITYYPNGSIKSIVRLNANGVQDGPSQYFYPSGVLYVSGTKRNGLSEGNVYWFYQSGRIKRHRFYKNGKEQGYVTDFYDDDYSTIKTILFFIDDSITYQKYFDTRGQLISQRGTKPEF